MPRSEHHLIAILRRGDFRRLLVTRVASQFGDGIFQASLAGSVLFNPDRQANGLAVGIGFAILLLPYSLIGPFVGVFLDRWSRRNVLVVANLLRCAVVPVVAVLIWSGSREWIFLLLALVGIGVNRFFLAGLSASLPHVARTDDLVTANSLSTTSGTVVYAVGIGVAVGLRSALGINDRGYGLVALIAVLFYLASAIAARGFARQQLGPDDSERERSSDLIDALLAVATGLAAGIRHLTERRVAGYAIVATSAHRIFYGVTTIAMLLLYRNYLTGTSLFPGGEVGLGQVVFAGAAGAFLGAVITPPATRRYHARTWITAMLLITGFVQLVLGVPYVTWTLVPAAFLVGTAAQGIKIVTDTAVQTECDDAYRGRVFSVYDTTFNVCLVLGLLLGAVLLPNTGKSYFVIGVATTGYLAVAAWYGWATARWSQAHTPVLESVH